MRRRRILWVALGLLAAAPLVYYLRAKLNGEHFYLGRPTSYWSREVASWAKDEDHWTAPWRDKLLALFRVRMKAIHPPCLDGDEQAIPVLKDLAQDDDAQVRRCSILALTTFPDTQS